jgi:C4-dicarboxylate-specific signal transduction histidine kinase
MAAEPDPVPRTPVGLGEAELDPASLLETIERLELRVQIAEERRRALLHIMGDLNESNRRLGDQRKAMLHILGDYEDDRSRLARQTERLDNSRRALLHILKDSHESNLKLGDSRKAMIHIMGDLRETTQEMERREHELRDKQEQLVQAGKLATLGELTTGVAHELNNPLNNIGLFVGNVIDQIRLGGVDQELLVGELEKAMEQVRKATEIISHLRTFGRAAPVSVERVDVDEVIERSLSLMQEQLRLRGIEVQLDLCSEPLIVFGNAIQLEQVFINLLSNARDALASSPKKTIRIASTVDGELIRITFVDSGPGIPRELEQRVFDPFFTTKEVGTGTGLGLSITYSIVKEHGGEITVTPATGGGAGFLIELPAGGEEPPAEPLL